MDLVETFLELRCSVRLLLFLICPLYTPFIQVSDLHHGLLSLPTYLFLPFNPSQSINNLLNV